MHKFLNYSSWCEAQLLPNYNFFINFIINYHYFFHLQELLAIQQQGPRAIGFFGTRNMGFLHQELIEILSYAMVITVEYVIYHRCIIEALFSL